MEPKVRLAGQLAWLELNTQRVADGQRYYTDMFGWQMQPVHVSPWGILSGFVNADRHFGHAFMALAAFHQSQWLCFLSADLERATTRAEEFGGKAFGPPNAYPGWSKTASVEDPAGTKVDLIDLESGDFPERMRFGDPVIAELWTHNPSKVVAFYEGLFDGTAEATNRGFVLKVKNDPRLLIRKFEDEHKDARFIPYVATRSLGADEIRAARFGAIVQVPEEEVPGVGRVTIFGDPTGAFFGLLEPTAD